VAPPEPVYAAVTDPEAADPGKPVSVTVQALTTGSTIAGCRAAFAGAGPTGCRHVGDRWTADLTVPDDARPGDLPLVWDVADETGGSGGGTVSYRVLGTAPREPQVDIALEPREVKAGDHVTVTHRILDEGVAISGCDVGYTPGGTMAACHDTGQGWVADVVVPAKAAPGTGTLLWRVAYTRAGAGGSAEGEVAMAVIPGDEESLLHKLWRVAWRGGGALLGVVALVGLSAAGRSVRRRWRQRGPEDEGSASGAVSVNLVRPHGPAVATPRDPQAPPLRVIRLTLRRGRSRIDVHEEL
jgi:hypothetical protein